MEVRRCTYAFFLPPRLPLESLFLLHAQPTTRAPFSPATHPPRALLGLRAPKSGVRPPNTAHSHMPCFAPPPSLACRANPGGGGILVHPTPAPRVGFPVGRRRSGDGHRNGHLRVGS